MPGVEVVAGGPADVVEVGHLVLRGTHREIGRSLAEVAQDRHGVAPAAGGDPAVTRARRHWYEREWPAHFQRMLGVADVHGLAVDDDAVELGLLAYLGAPPGCSVAWLPPEVVASGHPTLSRNYDFPAATLTEILGGVAQPGELAMTARPYVTETYPADGGRACLFIGAYELLGGCLDGVNDAGLVVAMLADDEPGGAGPTLAPAAGLNEIQVLRYLLETCTTTGEARAGLRAAQQYVMFQACHYLVADATGDSFVWESGRHVVEGAGEVQVVTNHLLHGRPSLEDLPAGDGPSATYARARRLTAAVAARAGPMSTDEIKAAHACVDRTDAGPVAPRTLWHGIYDAADRSLDVSFHLGDAVGGAGARRSPYRHFRLG